MKRITDFKAGQKKLSAEAMQGIAAESKRQQQLRPGMNFRATRGGVVYWPTFEKKQHSPPAASGAVQQFRVTNPDFPDTVLAEPWDGTASIGEAVHVAKPWLLRITHKLVATYRRAGLRFQAATTEPNSSIVAIRETDSTTETWRTTIAYVVGDIIYVSQLGDVFELEAGGQPVIFLDMNSDGRTWASDA